MLVSISIARRRTIAGALALLAALGPRGAALAAPRAPAPSNVVALPFVPMPGAPDAFAARVSTQVSNELKQHSELKLVDARLTARAGASSEKLNADAAKTRASAADLLNKASDLSQKGKAKQAALLLQKGAALLTAQPLALDEAGGKLLAEVLLQLAVDRAIAGEEDGSDAALAELVRRAPEKTLATGSLPPAFVRSFEAERQRALSSARASLRVLAPEGNASARVLLDGRPLGNAPLLLADVLPGEHAVRVESGDAAWAEALKIDAGGSSTLLPSFGRATGDTPAAWLAKGTLDKATAAKLGKIARDANAKGIVVGAVSREGDGYTVRSALVFARGDKVVALTSLTLDEEMLSGSLEALRFADDLVGKLSSPQSQAAADLPLRLGGADASASDASTFTTVSAAPPATEGAVSMPAPADLAAAAGTAKKPEELPLPPPPAASEPSASDRTPVIPGGAPRVVVPAPVAPTPVVPAPVVPARDRFPVLAATPPPAPLPPAPVPAPAQTTRTPVIPVKPVEPMPADAAPLATAAPKPRPEEPAPSKDLVVPRRATVKEEDEAPAVAPPPRAAPKIAVQVEAREANEVATVHDQPAKKNHTVLWIVAGALVVGAAAVGGVVLYENSRTASSSNVSLSWSH